jgi:hypothetical protein
MRNGVDGLRTIRGMSTRRSSLIHDARAAIR